MQKQLIESKSDFSFILSGESEIEVSALTSILEKTVSITKDVSSLIPDAYAKVKVTSFKEGSFEVEFATVVASTLTLLSDPNNSASLFVNSVIDVFKLFKHLHGNPPSTVNNLENNECEVINNSGDGVTISQNVYHLYIERPELEKSVLDINKNVNGDNRDGYKVKSATTNTDVYIDQDDLEVSTPVVPEILNLNTDQHISRVNTNLLIRKPDLTGESKWGFVFDKNIEAAIEDQEWLNLIRENHTAFSGGMMLPVTLRTEVNLDNNGNSVPGTTKYYVESVTGDIIRPNNPSTQEEL